MNLKDLKGAVPSHEDKIGKTPDQHRTAHHDGALCRSGLLREYGGVRFWQTPHGSVLKESAPPPREQSLACLALGHLSREERAPRT